MEGKGDEVTGTGGACALEQLLRERTHSHQVEGSEGLVAASLLSSI